MDIAAYLDQVRAKYASGQATEHSYRPALQSLFESIDPALTVIKLKSYSGKQRERRRAIPNMIRYGVSPVDWCGRRKPAGLPGTISEHAIGDWLR